MIEKEKIGSPSCTICEPSDLRFQELLTGKTWPPNRGNLICAPADAGM
jgi:hypothetical protein